MSAANKGGRPLKPAVTKHGKAMQAAMAAQGLSLEAAAAKCGLNTDAMRRVSHEADPDCLPVRLVASVARGLGISVGTIAPCMRRLQQTG